MKVAGERDKAKAWDTETQSRVCLRKKKKKLSSSILPSNYLVAFGRVGYQTAAAAVDTRCSTAQRSTAQHRSAPTQQNKQQCCVKVDPFSSFGAFALVRQVLWTPDKSPLLESHIGTSGTILGVGWENSAVLQSPTKNSAVATIATTVTARGKAHRQ